MAVAAFRRGFRQRNPLVLVAAAALTALFLFLLQVAVTSGAFTAISQSRYDRIHNDDYVHITYKLGQLKRHPPKGATIYLFGGSEAMESIVSQTSLARAVAKAGGGQTAVISLAGHQQTLAQTLAIIDNLPRGNAVLLVGLAPSRFTTSPAQDVGLLSGKPFIAPSPRLAQLAPQLYGKSAPLDGILPGIFDYMISYASQRASLSRPWGARVSYAHHYYPAGAHAASTAAKRSTIAQVLAADQGNYAANSGYNFTVLRQIVLLGQERGFTVAFYDEPLNVAIGGAGWGGVATAYRARAELLAQRYGVAYLQPQAASNVTNGDFADLYHLLQRGRFKWQPVLARQLAAVLRGEGQPQATAEL